MMPRLSCLLMAVAAACLGEGRRGWADAMEAELEAARADGRPLSFAVGCLVAALRQMPGTVDGRLRLASHALALGVLVPAAFLQFACAIGLSSGRDGLYGALGVVGATEPLLVNAQLGAVPALLIPWLLLGSGHLWLAWALLERDWTGAARAGALMAAAQLTLFIFETMLLLDTAALRLSAATLTIEMMLVLAVARWHARNAELQGTEARQTT